MMRSLGAVIGTLLDPMKGVSTNVNLLFSPAAFLLMLLPARKEARFENTAG